MTQKKPKSDTTESVLGHVPISEIVPSPENDLIYQSVSPGDPRIVEMARSVRRHGILEPLVLGRDNRILSGHRRYAAARLAGLKDVPVRYDDVTWERDHDRCMELLVAYNEQREKSLQEILNEELFATDPDVAYHALLERRTPENTNELESFEIRSEIRRARISQAKLPFLIAVKKVLEEHRSYWPLSDRRVHYALLNNPPLRHASKPESRYDNSQQAYKALTNLLTRARVIGEIPMQAIGDTTRPVTVWRAFSDSREFVRKELDEFLLGYWRDLQVTQPNHIEIIVEKDAVAPIIRPVAMEYRIPLTVSRGHCSLPPRAAIANRFQRSGKDKLALLILSDHDADGVEICHSLPRSLRDDFGVKDCQLYPVRVALTADQASELKLPNALPPKRKSVNYKKFLAEFGNKCWELDALSPTQLQSVLRKAIDGVSNLDVLNAEIDQEKNDAAHLSAIKAAVAQALSGLSLDEEQGL